MVIFEMFLALNIYNENSEESLVCLRFCFENYSSAFVHLLRKTH